MECNRLGYTPFCFIKYNTRTTAVFTIKYLRSLGYKAENDMFKAHSWYFRNALARANYRNVAKGVEPTTEYLQLFLRNLILGETNELKNRHLHIRWHDNQRQNDVSATLKRQNDVSERLMLSLKETAILKLIMGNTSISVSELADKTDLSTRTVDRIIKSLKEKRIISRTGSTKQVNWQINLT